MAEKSRAPQSPQLLAPLQAQDVELTLSPDQESIVNLPQGSGPVAIWGAPGTGKSTTLVEAAIRRVNAGEIDPANILVLAPTRVAASRLRDAFTSRLGRSLGATPARSWAAYAYDLVRRAKAEGFLRLDEAPRLLSGPEQDQVIKELLVGPEQDVELARRFGWPRDLQAALGTRGFRQELRELYDRLVEHDAGPEQLSELAPLLSRPEWAAAARFFAEYRDVMDLKNPGAFDPSGIITDARSILAGNEDFYAAEQRRLELILVDDLHESSKNVLELFLDLSAGKDSIITLCPDTAALGFRGARPDLMAEVLEAGNFSQHQLRTSHRLSPGLSAAYQSVVRRVPTSLSGTQGRDLDATAQAQEVAEDSFEASVQAHVFANPGAELRFLSGEIMTEHLRHGRSLEDMVVIARNGNEVARIHRYLLAQGIASRTAVAETPVRDEPAVLPLMSVMGIAIGALPLDAPRAVELLMSRYGGASSTQLRRLKQVLRRDERIAEGTRNSEELLLDVLRDPEWAASLGVAAAPALRLARMIAAGQKAFAADAASGETVLWAIWAASGLAQQWSESALSTGPAGARADRDLDAVMALFGSAERYASQFPGSGAAGFHDYLTGQEIAMDTLAARAVVDEAVAILTPAGAAGLQWPVVYVAGIQDGVWPNTRLRGELLGSTQLADALEHGVQVARQRGPREKLADIRADELRTFALAISRCSERLCLSASDSEDGKASIFIDYAVPGASLAEKSSSHRPMDLRTMVAALRSRLEQAQPEDGEDNTNHQDAAAQDAAGVLAYLAREGVPGAAPQQWWGLLPLSTEEDLYGDGATVVVSPSKVEKVADSPLGWFVPAAGGAAATDLARSLGTLVHRVASERPEGSYEEYCSDLERLWPSLGLPPGWESERLWTKATGMVQQLARYIASMKAQGRQLVAVEIDVDVHVPGSVDVTQGPRHAGPAAGPKSISIRIRGQIDRLEQDESGRAYVVDLKTGAALPSKVEVNTHAQLGTYQAAINLGAFGVDSPAASSSADAQAEDAGVVLKRSGGAALVALGKKSGSIELVQEALSQDDGWAMELVQQSAQDMSRSHFEARHGQSGPGHAGCATPEVCPICHSGRQVTE